MSYHRTLLQPTRAMDRAAHRRAEPERISTLRRGGSTRVVVVHRGRAVAGDDGVALVDVPFAERVAGDAPETIWVFLGEGATGPVLGLILADDLDLETDFGYDLASVHTPVGRWIGLREILDGSGAGDAAPVVAAVGLAAWHAGHRFCPRCGAATTVEASGWVRRCSRQGTELYPRTDPAAIMAVTDQEDRLLLGHVGQWPEGRFSTLAGFVETGESAEDAVRREVLEEVGVRVGDVVYRGSQPWPFPGSLMLAYSARATSVDLFPDGEEITDARWFTREALATGIADGTVLMPSSASIARRLIEDWYGGELPGA